MNLAYCSSSKLPSREANSIQVMRMCEAFAAQGHRVTLYSRAGGTTDRVHAEYGVAESFAIERLPQRHWRAADQALFGLRVARRIARGRRPDLCYGRDVWSLLAVAVSRRGVPLILESHNPPRSVLARRVQAWLFARPAFRRLVVISNALAEDYRTMFPQVPAKRIVVAPSGASVAARHGRPASNGRLRVGYVGHLYEGRGVDVILELARQMDQAEFHLIGGTDEDLARWTVRARSLANVTWHGHIAPDRVGAMYADLDVLLAPYQPDVVTAGGTLRTGRWMSPMKIFEYMASGRAMVASDLPALREVLADGINALLVPCADIGAWRRSLERLQADRALRDRLAARARQDVAERYSWSARAERVLEGLGC